MDAMTLLDVQLAALEQLEHDEARARQYGDMALAILAGEFPRSARPNGYVAALIVKAGAGTLYGFSGYNSNAGTQFILAFDAADPAALTSASVPSVIIQAAGSSNFSYDAGIHGRRFLRGIVLANSSTAATYTAGTADCWFDAQYV